MADQRESVDAQTSAVETPTQPFGLPRWVTALVPLFLLGVVLGAFVVFSPLAGIDGGQPLPDVTVTHETLPNDETVVLHVRNNGPEPVTISQVLVDEAYWNYQVKGAGGDTTIEPMGSARVVIPYHWNPGWDLEAALVLSDGTTFHHTIVAPSQSPGLSGDLLGSFVLIGLFVGVIPIVLGMLWFPFLRSMADHWLHAILLFSTGVLTFLAIDAGFEAFELAATVPSAFEGTALVVLGAVGTLLFVQAVTDWQQGRTRADGGHTSGLWVAYLVAIGIGLHNLAEGLAIGSSFALGQVSLGTFLVVGFMLHNVTEGPAVVAPVAQGKRPALRHFTALGLIAGVPVILGGWIGSLAYSPTVGAFFLAVGVGAIAQVNWEIFGMVRDGDGRLGSALNLSAFLVGLVVMYATDLLVAI